MILKRYKQTLQVDSTEIYSYDTHVADIDHDSKIVIALDWYSVTTSKHINYVASQLGYKVVKSYELKKAYYQV